MLDPNGAQHMQLNQVDERQEQGFRLAGGDDGGKGAMAVGGFVFPPFCPSAYGGGWNPQIAGRVGGVVTGQVARIMSAVEVHQGAIEQ